MEHPTTLIFLPLPVSERYGRCVKYNKAGGYCGGFATCGCEKGYTCKFHYDAPKLAIAKPIELAKPVVQIVTKRSMIAGGYSKCESV